MPACTSISGYSSQFPRYRGNFSSLPEIISRKIRGRAGSALISYSTLLHVEIAAFHLAAQGCEMILEDTKHPKDLNLQLLLVSVALIRPDLRQETGVTRYVILRSPDFPPYNKVGQPRSACLYQRVL